MPDQHAETPGKSVIYSSTVTQRLGGVHCTTVQSILHPKHTMVARPTVKENRNNPSLKYTKRYYSPRMAKYEIFGQRNASTSTLKNSAFKKYKQNFYFSKMTNSPSKPFHSSSPKKSSKSFRKISKSAVYDRTDERDYPRQFNSDTPVVSVAGMYRNASPTRERPLQHIKNYKPAAKRPPAQTSKAATSPAPIIRPKAGKPSAIVANNTWTKIDRAAVEAAIKNNKEFNLINVKEVAFPFSPLTSAKRPTYPSAATMPALNENKSDGDSDDDSELARIATTKSDTTDTDYLNYKTDKSSKDRAATPFKSPPDESAFFDTLVRTQKSYSRAQQTQKTFQEVKRNSTTMFSTPTSGPSSAQASPELMFLLHPSSPMPKRTRTQEIILHLQQNPRLKNKANPNNKFFYGLGHTPSDLMACQLDWVANTDRVRTS